MNLEDIFGGPPSPSRWEALGRWLRSTRIIPGVGVRVSHDMLGTVISAKPGSHRVGGVSPCALGKMSPADPGPGVNISTGSIHAAGTHTPVGGNATTFTPTIGNEVWAEVSIEAEVEDDVFTGNWTASAAALSSGASVPSDHSWTPASATGKAYRSLGGWGDDGEGNPVWQGQSCGDVTFLWCADSPTTGEATSYRN